VDESIKYSPFSLWVGGWGGEGGWGDEVKETGHPHVGNRLFDLDHCPLHSLTEPASLRERGQRLLFALVNAEDFVQTRDNEDFHDTWADVAEDDAFSLGLRRLVHQGDLPDHRVGHERNAPEIHHNVGLGFVARFH